MISKIWREVDHDVKVKFVQYVNNLEINGPLVLQWSMGLDQDTGADELEFVNPFSHTCLYRTGLRATGFGQIPIKRLLYADFINGQVGTLKEKERKQTKSKQIRTRTELVPF